MWASCCGQEEGRERFADLLSFRVAYGTLSITMRECKVVAGVGWTTTDGLAVEGSTMSGSRIGIESSEVDVVGAAAATVRTSSTLADNSTFIIDNSTLIAQQWSNSHASAILIEKCQLIDSAYVVSGNDMIVGANVNVTTIANVSVLRRGAQLANNNAGKFVFSNNAMQMVSRTSPFTLSCKDGPTRLDAPIVWQCNHVNGSEEDAGSAAPLVDSDCAEGLPFDIIACATPSTTHSGSALNLSRSWSSSVSCDSPEIVSTYPKLLSASSLLGTSQNVTLVVSRRPRGAFLPGHQSVPSEYHQQLGNDHCCGAHEQHLHDRCAGPSRHAPVE